MKTMIVGYDGSEGAERALARAAEVAKGLSAQLVVVSVSRRALAVAPAPGLAATLPVTVAPGGAGAVPVGAVEPIPEDQVEKQPGPEELARRQLERARTFLATRGVEAEYVTDVGDPADRLLEQAEQRDADLIVVGSHEHGFLDRLLGRSVDETIARHSHRDVLLVH